MTTVLTNIQMQHIFQPDYGAKLAGPASIARVTDTCDDTWPQALDTAPKSMNRKTATEIEIRTWISYLYSVHWAGKCVAADIHQGTDGRQKITGDLEGKTTDVWRKSTFS